MYVTQNIDAKNWGSCEKPTCVSSSSLNLTVGRMGKLQAKKSSRIPYPDSNGLSGGSSGGATILMEMHSDIRLVGLQGGTKTVSSWHC